MMMIPSREIRHVPRGWAHPADRSLFEHTTEAEERAWCVEHGYDYDEVHPDGFDPADYMPAPGDDPQIMAYETVSEGTPLTGRAFDDDPPGRIDLIRDLVDSQETIAGTLPDGEAWAGILFAQRGLLNIATGQIEARA